QAFRVGPGGDVQVVPRRRRPRDRVLQVQQGGRPRAGVEVGAGGADEQGVGGGFEDGHHDAGRGAGAPRGGGGPGEGQGGHAGGRGKGGGGRGRGRRPRRSRPAPTPASRCR